ncbi:divalent metal cation transporter [Streptomyces sp. NPDC002917]|uniref:divalent metal cation transporter n=1 Tax=Streptomyces sp. NPDC002917 TaxID=3364671 RepID=UPI00369323FD
MLLQYLSAKLGVATGKSLPELCRARYRRPVVWGLWAQAEAVVVMTDLAEVVGGAIALHLLFGLPLWLGGVGWAVMPAMCRRRVPCSRNASAYRRLTEDSLRATLYNIEMITPTWSQPRTLYRPDLRR